VCLPFGHPNLLVSFLTVGVAFLVAFGDLFLKRWQLGIILAIVGLAAFATLSTGFGGFALSLVLATAGRVWLAGGKLSKQHLSLLIVAVAGAGFLATATIGHQVPRGQGQIALGSRDWDFLKGSRPYLWRSAIDTMSARPITGSGYGSVPAAAPQRWRFWYDSDDWERLTGVPTVRIDAHNMWLNVGGRAGLLGLGLFIWLVMHSVRGISLRPITGDHLLGRSSVATAAAVTGGLFFHGLFESLEGARHVWFLLALAAVTSSLRSAPYP
jgi:O-antigen ligase